MKIIDEELTFGALAILRARLGLRIISNFFVDDGSRVAVVEYLDGFPRVFYGDGATEAEALNDAIVKGETARQEQRARQAAQEGTP